MDQREPAPYEQEASNTDSDPAISGKGDRCEFEASWTLAVPLESDVGRNAVELCI